MLLSSSGRTFSWVGGGGSRQLPTRATSSAIPTHLNTETKMPRGHNPRAFLVVEVAGIEPASFVDNQGLLRAQPAVLFLSPSDLADLSLSGDSHCELSIEPP